MVPVLMANPHYPLEIKRGKENPPSPGARPTMFDDITQRVTHIFDMLNKGVLKWWYPQIIHFIFRFSIT